MNQKPRTIQEQLARLKEKGMVFNDEIIATAYLARISYFRLKYYWVDMIDTNSGRFMSGANFNVVIDRYEFDRNSDPFVRQYIFDHPNWDKSSLNGDNPDAWMIFETATFGTLSKMFKNLRNQSPLKSRIANEFGLFSARELSSWLEAISVLRTIIAHHSRIWYKIFSKKPTNINRHRDDWMLSDMTEHQHKRAFGVISCLLYLCNAINPENTIKEDIKNLFASYPNVPIFMIGFTREWERNPIWQ